MSAALPAAPVVVGEVRALTLFDAVPHDCGGVLVPHDRFGPHLRAGEIAVVDPDDNEPQHGEIYVVTIATPHEPGGVVLKFVQLRRKVFDFVEKGEDGRDRREPGIGWMMHFDLMVTRSRPLTTDEIIALAVAGRGLCDGPLGTDGMRRKIVGRVVGIVPAEEAENRA